MDPYTQELLTYLLSGLIIGVGLVVWGAFHKKWMVRLLAFVVGILVIWYGLVMGPLRWASRDLTGVVIQPIHETWEDARNAGLVRWRVSAMKKAP